MIKCTNCNAENPEGSCFCSTCGKKLEVTVTCPACGGKAAQASAFCPWCGESLKGKKTALMSDNVIAGDVSVDSSTKIDASTNYNDSIVNIYNQTTSEIVVKCHACGKSLHQEGGDAYKCPACGELYCSDCFDLSLKLCANCTDAAHRLFFSRRYDEAGKYYRQAIANETAEADAYYRSAICLLKGQKAFVQQRSTIDQILDFMDGALQLEQKAIYYYFLAYIKYDYFKRKFYNVTPDYKACYQLALSKGLEEAEISEMYELMGVARPTCL